MPIYEYQCQKCGDTLEMIHPASESKRPRCDECCTVMKKLISPSAFILKGSGWYVTDYPSQSRKEGMEAEKKASGPNGTGKAGKGKKPSSARKKTPKKVQSGG